MTPKHSPTGPAATAEDDAQTGAPAPASAPAILVDADACPVKDEIYKVAERHKVRVTLVANDFLRFPRGGLVSLQVVSDAFDAADDWIADTAAAGTVVVTADILLAQRCLDKGAIVLAPTGKRFTDASIGTAVATRGIMADLRASVGTKADSPGHGAGHFGGPAAFSKADRSRFLQALHEVLLQQTRR